MSKQSFTLREIADRWTCSHSTVLALVKSGSLVAIDISSNRAGRSHFIVMSDALADFEERNTVSAPSPPPKRREKIRTREVTEFIK